MTGRIHSFQSLGTLDGPGVRFVVFLQGCNLRCGCCHNPDTWTLEGALTFSAQEVLEKALRYRSYFGEEGGITVSGGEPLLQAGFVKELFSLCREKGVNTCLDTSGSLWNEEISALLPLCDRVLLDIKYTREEDYLSHVGCSMETPLAFLRRLNGQNIPTTLRQVIIPGKNDTEENIRLLRRLWRETPCVDQVELLPFRKLCQVKYDNLGIPFPFAHVPEPTKAQMTELESLINA